ncbi:DNA-binding transcriptional regulator YdaS (Cro superfamily) [Rhodoligotrophos appendicifer]|uniref:helix-turn-helix domain-containing protein n=1 Tax=Rhodoligotrophos appendicifer TaxID=987056 RepID=UPI001186C0F8|nr:helix-turn-helix domain-containing protein [Rhodoligotrophos appendicifer]
MKNAALERAVNLVGGQSRLAKLIGTTQSRIWYWLTRAKRGVPGEYVLLVERATAGAIKRSELRPDLYPPHSSGALPSTQKQQCDNDPEGIEVLP